MGRFVRDGHMVRAVHLHEQAGGGELAGAARREALEIDALGSRLLAAPAAFPFPEDADVVNDDVLRGSDPEGEVAQGFQRKGNAILVPLALDARLQRLAVTGSDVERTLLGEGLGPEREYIRLPGLEGHIDRQHSAVGHRLRGIVAREDIIQALEDFESLGREAVQGAGLEVPVPLEEGGVVVRRGFRNQIVQVRALLLAVPAERVAEQLGPARLRPAGHRIGVRAVRLDDAVVLHFVAEGDGGEIALEDIRDLGVVPVLPVGERDAQLEAGLRGNVLQVVLVIVHHLLGRRVRRDRFLLRLLGSDGRGVFLPAGDGGQDQGGQEDKGTYLFHTHAIPCKIRKKERI